jgi:hypothetical protein
MDRPAPDLGPEGTGGNRTKLLALGGVVALLVVALVAYLLVFSGGEEPLEEGVAPVTPSSSGGGADPAPEPATNALPKLSNKNFGKDPFKPLIVEPAAAVAPVAADPVGTTPGTTGTVLPGATTGSTDTGSSAPSTSTPAESTSHTFKVVDVAPDNSRISVRVDGKVYRNLKAGEVFATYFKVRLISGQVNSVQYGDEKFNVSGKVKLTIA